MHFISTKSFLERLDQVLDDNYADCEFTLYCICKTLNVSRSQLHRRIKANYCVTTTQYINSFRLSKAEELMVDKPNLSISEIANSVGYKDPNYFSKLYKNEYGFSPSTKEPNFIGSENHYRL